MENVKIFIVIVVLVVIGLLIAQITPPGSPLNNTQGEELVDTMRASVSGVVSAIDLGAMAYDGPGRIVVLSEEGNYVVVAVPSMGLPFCAAAPNMASVGIIAIGDRIAAAGTLNPSGAIVPCESADDYLAIEKPVSDEDSLPE